MDCQFDDKTSNPGKSLGYGHSLLEEQRTSLLLQHPHPMKGMAYPYSSSDGLPAMYMIRPSRIIPPLIPQATPDPQLLIQLRNIKFIPRKCTAEDKRPTTAIKAPKKRME